MRRRPEQFAGALLHRDRWVTLGFHSRHLSSPGFTTVFPGYQTPTDHPASFDAMAWALQNRVLPGCVLSHTTAALLWGIPFPVHIDGGISLLRGPDLPMGHTVEAIPAVVPGESLRTGAVLPVLHGRLGPIGSSAVGRGVVVHRWREGPTADLGRLVVSAPSEVLRELATMLPLWDVVAAVDAVLGPRFPSPGPSRQELVAHVGQARGLHGVPRLRAALPHAREHVRSPAETLARLILVSAGFPEPVANFAVRDPLTGRPRIIDLAWPRIGLGLEYDGDGHRLTKDQWREDEARRDELASYGWTLVRANGEDNRHPLRILLRLARTMSERGLQVPAPDSIRRFVAALGPKRVSMQISRDQPRA